MAGRKVIAKLLENVNRFPLRFPAAAEQLNKKQRWARLVRIILREFFPRRAQDPRRCSVERGQLPGLGSQTSALVSGQNV
jgi:hypothetical protein